jgi:broad specificity phosphatase PhoE
MSKYKHNATPIFDELEIIYKVDPARLNYTNGRLVPFVFIRHAQSEGNVDKSVYDHKHDSNILITELGVKQAQLIGKCLIELFGNKIKKPKILVYCSPYIRTRQTLDVIMSEFNNRKNSPIVQFDIKENILLIEQGITEPLLQTYIRSELFYQRNILNNDMFNLQERIPPMNGNLLHYPYRTEYDAVFFVGHGAQTKTLIASMLNDHSFIESYVDRSVMRNCECIILNYDQVRNGTYDPVYNFYPHMTTDNPVPVMPLP